MAWMAIEVREMLFGKGAEVTELSFRLELRESEYKILRRALS